MGRACLDTGQRSAGDSGRDQPRDPPPGPAFPAVPLRAGVDAVKQVKFQLVFVFFFFHVDNQPF